MYKFLKNLIWYDFLGWLKVHYRCTPNLVDDLSSYCEQHGEVFAVTMDAADIVTSDDLFNALISGFKLPADTPHSWSGLQDGFRAMLADDNVLRFVLYVYNGRHLLCRLPGAFFEFIGIVDRLNIFESDHFRLIFLLDLDIDPLDQEYDPEQYEHWFASLDTFERPMDQR